MFYQHLIFVFLAGIPYFLSLDGEFVFDDTEAILKNNDVTSVSWSEPFNHDFWGSQIDSSLSHKSYRPLTILSFKLNYLINRRQLSAFQFKITNVVLHILCSTLLLIIYKIILNKCNFKHSSCMDVGFSATLLFSTHPIHVENVSGIVGRADILAAISFFLSFLMYDKAMTGQCFGYLLISLLFSGTSMLFKENGITVLGFCIVYEIIAKLKCIKRDLKTHNINNIRKKYNTSISRLFIVLCAIVILLYLRWMVMAGVKPVFKSTDNPAAFANNSFTRIATHNYIYFINTLLLVWPQWSCYDWSMGCIPLIQDCSDFRILFIISLYAALCLFGVYIYKSRGHTRILILSTSLMIIPFLPASNLFYPVGFVVAERILYIPSAGYCLLVAVGLQKIIVRLKSLVLRKLTLYLFYFVVLIYGLKSAQRSFEWQNEFKLFTSGLQVCPLNAKIHYNIAKVADAKDNLTWAMEEYKEAIRLYPEYYQAMNNVANLLKNHKQFGDAESYLRKALALKPDFPAAWMNLGIILASTKRYKQSEMAYKNALTYRKNYPDCYYNMGNLYLEINKIDTAMESWLNAIELNPKHNSAWTNLLAMLDNNGEIDKALQLIPKALKELPASPSIKFAVANIYGKMDKYEDAEEYFLRAIEIFGINAKPIHFANLGVLYHRWKKYDLAETMYRKALEIQPSFGSALKNLDNLKRVKKRNK
ncbi:protein O-mannosyl-transferase TMTC4 [Pieris brassicae]|uniref:protein O-mannosyl-transferase TMTC4 n=1 Tax=Pieris brassicae TaxID=7116 RepID=UPI001E66284E|nr:protein O-mannosyl-transferase TMTC4 [Pieris brassicae]